jgi:hypothetical protein
VKIIAKVAFGRAKIKSRSCIWTATGDGPMEQLVRENRKNTEDPRSKASVRSSTEVHSKSSCRREPQGRRQSSRWQVNAFLLFKQGVEKEFRK